MNFRKYGITDNFVLEVDGNALLMSREEAETLFVMIGHTLQDHDLERYQKESGDDSDQPSGRPPEQEE